MSEILNSVDTEAVVELEIVDLGDAVVETKEAFPIPYAVDNTYASGWA
jgi:hypothetical protein